MSRYFSKSFLLFLFVIPTVCIIYPAVLWAIGQVFFPFQANGSIVNGPDGKPVGSMLIAQPFTKNEYFQPRPSAASYDASASAPSNLSASNYALRDRVARSLGPIVTYSDGPKKGQQVAPDIEAWFQQDKFGGQPHIVAQWDDAHNELATGWVSADPTHAAYVDDWTKKHSNEVSKWKKDNPGTPDPKAADLAVLFFETFSKDNPGKGVGLGSRSSYQLAERRVSIGSHFPEMGLRYQARSKTGSQRDRADGGGERVGAVRRARGREVRQRTATQPRIEKQVRAASIGQ
jgi:K+-transporting ATPase ATPase C chain